MKKVSLTEQVKARKRVEKEKAEATRKIIREFLEGKLPAIKNTPVDIKDAMKKSDMVLGAVNVQPVGRVPRAKKTRAEGLASATSKDKTRLILSKVHVTDEFTEATNGKILVRVPTTSSEDRRGVVDLDTGEIIERTYYSTDNVIPDIQYQSNPHATFDFESLYSKVSGIEKARKRIPGSRKLRSSFPAVITFPENKKLHVSSVELHSLLQALGRAGFTGRMIWYFNPDNFFGPSIIANTEILGYQEGMTYLPKAFGVIMPLREESDPDIFTYLDISPAKG